MTLAYRPGSSIAHRLDPRSKLAVQVGFAAAAFAHTTPRGLAFLTVLALAVLASARLSPVRAAYEYRWLLVLLLVAPVVEGLAIGSPWFRLRDAIDPALASYRILLVLLVSGAYVRTTAARESRAAIQSLVPGRTGQFLGMGTALVVRFVPLLRADLLRIREASDARLGSERPLRERMSTIAGRGVVRALSRADRLALALRARCFSWNPTLPPLRFARLDVPALALAAALVASPLL